LSLANLVVFLSSSPKSPNDTPTMTTFPTFPDLHGKVGLVMGIGQTQVEGSSIWGNGAAMARALSQNGVKLFGCDLSLKTALFTASRLRKQGGTCDVMAADVTSSSDLRSVDEAAMQKYGRIDNNVGMTQPGDPASLSEELWESQLALNLTSVYLACHHVLPIMEK
jgi:NAD(P)-dependent dehydrogenase (short-subunit alcohol dehydrogenase family)